MAIIILAPGETFAHIHEEASRTELESGRVQFRIEDSLVPLEPGKPQDVPARAPHVLHNVGDTEARVHCYH